MEDCCGDLRSGLQRLYRITTSPGLGPVVPTHFVEKADCVEVDGFYLPLLRVRGQIEFCQQPTCRQGQLQTKVDGSQLKFDKRTYRHRHHP